MNVALYFHFPFCVRKCPYCSFHSVAGSDFPIDMYVAALVREMLLCRQEYDRSYSVGSLFFGGGTPSLMEPAHVEMIIAAALKSFAVRSDAEITIEANPGTLSGEKLAGYRSCGINRLSLGIQSFNDSMLRRLERIHTGAEARAAFQLARNNGFTNVGIDLINSLPGQTMAMWQEDLSAAIDLGPEHVSVYGLTIEERTPFAAMEESGALILPGDEESAAMYENTASLLSAAGYEHYEISNYAGPGYRSRHNQVYWQRDNYFGFGSGAHSFMKKPGFGVRWRNPDDIAEYVDVLQGGQLPWRERQDLSVREAMAEKLFLGLRMLEGVDLELFRDEFGAGFEEVYPKESSLLLAEGMLEIAGGRLRLAEKSLLVSNRIFMMFL